MRTRSVVEKVEVEVAEHIVSAVVADTGVVVEVGLQAAAVTDTADLGFLEFDTADLGSLGFGWVGWG